MKRCRSLVAILLTFAVSVCLNGGVSVNASSGTEVADSENILHQHYGSSSGGGGCYTTSVLHEHVGDTTNGGECFQTPVYTNYGTTAGTEEVVCGLRTSGVPTGNTIGGAPTYKYTCSKGHVYISWKGQEPTYCNHVVSTQPYNKCNFCGSKSCNGKHRTSWSLSCDKEGTVDHYDLGCGLSDGDISGKVTMTKTVSTNYVLSVALESSNGVTPVGYSWNTGATTSSVEVTGNTDYSCTVSYNDKGRVDSVTVSYTVTDFDTTPPVITQVSYNKERCQGSVVVSVSATDNFSGVKDYKLEKN